MSLVTGDIDGDGIEDLVIGAPNVNNGDGIVYVIRGSYIADNQGQIININSDNSFSDQKILLLIILGLSLILPLQGLILAMQWRWAILTEMAV